MAKKSSGIVVGVETQDIASPHLASVPTQNIASVQTIAGGALGEAEQLVNELMAGVVETQNLASLQNIASQNIASVRQVEQIEQLQEQVAAQGEQIEALGERVEKVTDLLTRSLQSMAQMQRNLLRLDGEQVLSIPTQMSGNINPLEQMHPVPKAPPAAPRSRANLSVEQRAIEAQRAKAGRMTG